MPDPVRRLSVPPLAGLEGQRCGALGGGGVAVRIPHSFPLQTFSNQGSHLPAFLPPFVHQRGGSGGGYSGPCGQECGGACSSAFPRLLQPAFRFVEDLRILEIRHRSLDPQFVRGCVALPHGGHPVGPSLCSSGRLDGLHRPQGSLPAGPCPSRLSAHPSNPVCGSGQCLPVLCPLLRPLHGSTGLLTGHGSCFRHSPFLLYPHEAVPRRLARPVVLSRVSPSRPQCGPRSLPRAGDCCESGEVTPRAFPDSPVSRGCGRLAVFPGFSIAGACRQASVNRRRISILRRSSSEYLALAARHAVLSLPSRYWRPTSCEISPTLSPQVLGSRGPVSQDSLDSRLPQGSSVVARPSPSGSGVSGSGLLVRRLRRGLGSSSGFSHCFRPLGFRSGLSVHQRSGASGHQGGSPPLPLFSGREECSSILRQLHSGVVSPQGGGHQVAVPQLPGSGDSPLDGVLLHPTVTPVHSGVPERSGGLSLSPSPAPSYRVVSSPGGFSVYQSHVAGPIRLIYNIRKSPMFSLFLSLLGSVGCGHRRLPPTLGRASGLRISSVVCHSTGACEAPGVSGDGTHPDSSLLASASLVSRPPSPVAGPSGCSASPSRPPASASVSQPLPGSPQASPSCLETLRCFTRAAGFSSTVASQASLSRRPSSRKAYQLKWQVYRAWCHSHGHSVSRPSLSKVAEFLCWLRSAKHLGVSSIRGYRSMLSAVFRFQLPSLSSHPVLRDLLRSFCLESAERQLRTPAWDLSLVLRFLNTSTFEPFSVAPLRALTQKVLFLLSLATAKRVGVTGSVICCHLRSW